MNQMQLAMRHVNSFKGERVYIKSIGDRNRIVFLEGVIDGVYPSLFTLLFDTEDGPCKRCFSYTDLLTHRLFIRRCE